VCYGIEGIAIIVTAVGIGYAKLQGHLTFPSLLLTNLGVLLVSIAAFWVALSLTDSPWPRFVLFIWAEVATILISLELWGLAGRLFHVRQGKRLFGLIGSGGITAGIIGGLLVPVLVPLVGTTNLLFFSLGGIAMSVLTLRYILRTFSVNLAPREKEEPQDQNGSWSRLFKDRYLVLTCLVAGMSIPSSTVALQDQPQIHRKSLIDKEGVLEDLPRR